MHVCYKKWHCGQLMKERGLFANGIDTFAIQNLFFLFFIFFYYFYLYIYPPDSQESNGGAIHRASNYPHLHPEMPRYCCPLKILIRYDFNLELLVKTTKQGNEP